MQIKLFQFLTAFKTSVALNKESKGYEYSLFSLQMWSPSVASLIESRYSFRSDLFRDTFAARRFSVQHLPSLLPRTLITEALNASREIVAITSHSKRERALITIAIRLYANCATSWKIYGSKLLLPSLSLFFSFSMALSHGIGSLLFCSFSASFFPFLRFISANFHSPRSVSLQKILFLRENKRQSIGDIFLSLCSVVRSPLCVGFHKSTTFADATCAREGVKQKRTRLRESLKLLWNDSGGSPL